MSDDANNIKLDVKKGGMNADRKAKAVAYLVRYGHRHTRKEILALLALAEAADNALAQGKKAAVVPMDAVSSLLCAPARKAEKVVQVLENHDLLHREGAWGHQFTLIFPEEWTAA